jgi:lipopolysaccharide heptosyltransferase II
VTNGYNHLSPDILAVRFSAIGDILLTTPLRRAIRVRHPGARIAVLTKRQYAPLLSDNPNINEVFGITENDSIRRVAEQIRSVHYSHILDLHGNLRTFALRLLAPGPWTSYSKRNIPRRAQILTKRSLFSGKAPPVAERYFEAAATLDVWPDDGPPEFFLAEGVEDEVEARLQKVGLGTASTLVAIAPGAAHATKRWPPLSWIDLARDLRRTGTEVVVVGGPDDAKLAQWIANDVGPGAASLAGVLNLQETGAVIKRSAALISGDTGVMHMATGLGTPVVALFGPTVREFGFFPYKSKRAEVVELPLRCRPCSAHGSSRCPLGHHRCMKEISPASVLDALRAALA